MGGHESAGDHCGVSFCFFPGSEGQRECGGDGYRAFLCLFSFGSAAMAPFFRRAIPVRGVPSGKCEPDHQSGVSCGASSSGGGSFGFSRECCGAPAFSPLPGFHRLFAFHLAFAAPGCGGGILFHLGDCGLSGRSRGFHSGYSRAPGHRADGFVFLHTHYLSPVDGPRQSVVAASGQSHGRVCFGDSRYCFAPSGGRCIDDCGCGVRGCIL